MSTSLKFLSVAKIIVWLSLPNIPVTRIPIWLEEGKVKADEKLGSMQRLPVESVMKKCDSIYHRAAALTCTFCCLPHQIKILHAEENKNSSMSFNC